MSATSPSGSDLVDVLDVLSRWQLHLEISGRCNANTRRQYRRYLLGFLADLMRDPRSLTEDDLIEWAAGTDRHGEMYGMTLRAVRSFCRWATDRGEMAEDATRHIQIPRRRRRPPPKTPDADLERLFACATRLDPRAGPTIELMFATGARLGSIVAVMPEDVDLEGRKVCFREAKGNDLYFSALVLEWGGESWGTIACINIGSTSTPTQHRNWIELIAWRFHGFFSKEGSAGANAVDRHAPRKTMDAAWDWALARVDRYDIEHLIYWPSWPDYPLAFTRGYGVNRYEIPARGSDHSDHHHTDFVPKRSGADRC